MVSESTGPWILSIVSALVVAASNIVYNSVKITKWSTQIEEQIKAQKETWNVFADNEDKAHKSINRRIDEIEPRLASIDQNVLDIYKIAAKGELVEKP